MPPVTETHRQQTEVPFRKTVTIPYSKYMRNNLNVHVLLNSCTQEMRDKKYNGGRDTHTEAERRGKGRDGKANFFQRNKLSHG